MGNDQQERTEDGAFTGSPPLCLEPWESYYILRRGILPCCYGYDPIAPMSEWKTAWNSPALQEIRAHLARGELSPYCRQSTACPIVQRVLAQGPGQGLIPANLESRRFPVLNRPAGSIPSTLLLRLKRLLGGFRQR